MASVDILQVRGNGFIRYREAYREPGQRSGVFSRAMDALKAQKAAERMEKARGAAYQVGFSEGAKKRLSRAITIMAQACSPRWVKNQRGQMQYFRMAFLTCTFAAPVSVETGKEIFFLFLRWLREKKGVRADIWKMEYTAGENPHFHSLLSDYVNVSEAQARWDQLQRDFQVTQVTALKTGSYKTNGVDIKHVGKVNDLAAYMAKELLKNVQAKAVAVKKQIQESNPGISDEDLKAEVKKQLQLIVKTDGKVWDCSLNLRGVKYFSVVMTAAHVEAIAQLEKQKKAFCINDDFFSIIKLSDTSPPDLLDLVERDRYQQHVRQIFETEAAPVIEIQPEVFKVQPDTKKVYTWQQMQIFQQ